MHHDFGENGEGSRDTEDWITDSTSKILLNSRFDKQKFPGFWNSGYLYMARYTEFSMGWSL